MTMVPPPDDDEEPNLADFRDTIAVAQLILIALLAVALVLLTPVAHPEWFSHLDTSGTSSETR